MHTVSNRKQFLWGSFYLLVMLCLPPAGAAAAGENVWPYLSFPPVSNDPGSSSFSWAIFLPMVLLIVAAVWPFLRRLVRGRWKTRAKGRFPVWGWISLAGLIVFWTLAWNRFSIFEPLQRFTFFPLWFCMIVTVNGLAVRLSGRSLMTERPLYFMLLFPASSIFWWVFEYLNRFVSNWHYVGVEEIGALQYFLEASLSFSTVLPAVMSVRFVLLRVPVFRQEFENFPSFPLLKSDRLWNLLGVLSIAGLGVLGWKPEYTYPLLWIAPGLLWIAFQKRMGFDDPLVVKALRGDMTLLWSSAVAALVCGFFWEMWNFYSAAKWVYTIPGVDGFHLFEMPVAGYAGYLPFGVICALVSYALMELLPGPGESENPVSR